MKKLLIIMTLFMSSFFLFCNKEVKAYEYTKEIDFFSMDTVLSLKEKLDAFIETDTEYSDYYLIYSDFDGSIVYYIIPLDGSLDNFSFSTDSSFFGLRYGSSIKTGNDLNSIIIAGSSSSKFFYSYHKNNFSYNVLYMNFDYYFTSGNSTITYTYNDFSVVNNLSSGNKFLTLYDVYLEYQNQLGNIDEIHKEELEKVGSFYNIVIEKLGYLSETIVSNYIYLSIIVIFILIFVFLLIFRRFL